MGRDWLTLTGVGVGQLEWKEREGRTSVREEREGGRGEGEREGRSEEIERHHITSRTRLTFRVTTRDPLHATYHNVQLYTPTSGKGNSTSQCKLPGCVYVYTVTSAHTDQHNKGLLRNSFITNPPGPSIKCLMSWSWGEGSHYRVLRHRDNDILDFYGIVGKFHFCKRFDYTLVICIL